MKTLPLLSLLISGGVLAAPISVTKNQDVTTTSVKGLEQLAKDQHLKSTHCGGFVASYTGETFLSPMMRFDNLVTDYTLSRGPLVQTLIKQVSPERMLATMTWFSSYPSRFYTTDSGVKAMKDLADKWKKLVKNLDYASVELVEHSDYRQNSVILTVKGKTDKVIVVGGHGDSINTAEGGPNPMAPGADDNASGISVITEVIQILADNDYQPNNTIKFMAYAAEEVGLLGSMDISARFNEQKVNVLGVIQFDGTNYAGSKDLSMVLIKDGTDARQNQFLGSLLDTYLKVPWNYDSCGYACSDHYSWTYRGYTASFPAESRIAEENPHIHSKLDTLDVSKNSAIHSVAFAQLGLAYVVELDK